MSHYRSIRNAQSLVPAYRRDPEPEPEPVLSLSDTRPYRFAARGPLTARVQRVKFSCRPSTGVTVLLLFALATLAVVIVVGSCAPYHTNSAVSNNTSQSAGQDGSLHDQQQDAEDGQ